MDIAKLLLKDVFYEKDANDEYVLTENDEFIESDINELITHITTALEETFAQFAHKRPFLFKCKMHIDHTALKQALSKYTRDVFGQRRLSTLLKKLPKHQHIFKKMEKFGLKINSFDPYIHRRVGCFFYWIFMLKPFHIEIRDDIIIPSNDRYIVSYFNELCAYILIKMMLGGCKIKVCNESDCPHKTNKTSKLDCCLTINLDKDRHLFQDFLYAGHFRKLSRSSLELFLSKSCIVPFCSLGPCPLTNTNAHDLHLLFTIS